MRDTRIVPDHEKSTLFVCFWACAWCPSQNKSNPTGSTCIQIFWLCLGYSCTSFQMIWDLLERFNYTWHKTCSDVTAILEVGSSIEWNWYYCMIWSERKIKKREEEKKWKSLPARARDWTQAPRWIVTDLRLLSYACFSHGCMDMKWF